MVSTGVVIVAVSIMVVFTAQTYGENTEPEWTKPILDNVKNLASKLRSSANSEIVGAAKTKYLEFVDIFKANTAAFNTNIQGKADAPDALKETVQSFKAEVESYKTPSFESEGNQVADQYEGAAKWILNKGIDISKKAQGAGVESDIRTFGKQQMDKLTATLQSIVN